MGEPLFLVRCRTIAYLDKDGIRHMNKSIAPTMTREEAERAKEIHDKDFGGDAAVIEPCQ
jgi:hypothetical protein